MGYIIENRVIRAALLERMYTFSNIDFICPATIDDIQIKQDEVRLILQGGGSISGQLLVGADGGRSQVREAMEITSIGWPYYQKGVVATVANITESSQHRLATFPCHRAFGFFTFKRWTQLDCLEHYS